MVICTVEVNEKAPQTIVIGRRGTYNTQEVVFDIGYLIDAYGVGTAVLAVKRSQDSSAYPAVVAQEDSTVTWTVSETDTYYKGAGECELMWYVDGGLAKTIIYPMVVMRDILSTTEEAPDAYQTWVDNLTALGAETLQHAQAAAESAADAEDAKNDAVTAKGAAETAQEAAEEAQDKAETAVSHYPVIINGYWNIWSVEAQTYVSTGVKAKGEDGYSPEVTITTITGGHRVTITDKDHPQGQSFDVMDGQGGGGTSDYTDLTNKPQINGHTLSGNQTAAQLGLATPSDIPTVPVQSVAGRTGAVVLNAGDSSFSDSETYASGSVGAELTDQKNAISQKQTAPQTAGTAGQVLGLDSNLDPVWVNQSGGGDVSNCAPIIINTASGDVASFADGADNRQIRKIVGTIVPVQSGTGDPSPNNVRPISGWTGANIYQLAGLPSGYKVADYVEIRDGFTIPTTIDFNAQDVEVFCTFRPVAYRQYASLYKVYENENAVATRIIFGSAIDRLLINNNSKASSPTSITINSNVFNTIRNCYGKCYLNGQEISISTTAGNRTNSNFVVGQAGSYWDVKGIAVYKNDVKLLNLVPCINDNDVAGLYETITGQFYTTPNPSLIIAYGTFNGIDYLSTYTLPINWQTEAGTIYGGNFTLNEDGSADVVSDRTTFTLNGTQTLGSPGSSDATDCTCRNTDLPFATIATTPNGLSDMFKWQTNNIAGNPNANPWAAVNYLSATKLTFCVSNADVGITSEMTRAEKSTAINQFFAEHPATFVLPLATPQTYHIPNIGQLYTYLGTNNVWIDTGAITECDYPADTKTYVDENGGGAVDDVQINGTSILSDGVANIPLGGANRLGVVRCLQGYGVGITNDGLIYAYGANTTIQFKRLNDLYLPVTMSTAVPTLFYALAKLAGDATQSASSNPAGTYTEDAKSAIHGMLNGAVTVSGTTPTIAAKDGITYVCGEVATLDITLPASGIFEVQFVSGSTPTVLTATGVSWVGGFDPTALEANKTYDISISNGIGVAVWI